MNHREFERQCWAEPHRQDAEFLAACDADETNRAIYQAAQDFEQRLRAALTVAVPADLAQTLLSRAARPDIEDDVDNPAAKVAVVSDTTGKRGVGRPPVWGWAMAASVVLSLTLGGFLGYHWQPTESSASDLDVVIMEHMMHEYAALNNVQTVSRQQLDGVMMPFGFKATDEIGPVVHASICGIKNRPGIHLILRVQDQPVTVLFINKAQVDAMQVLGYQGFSGIVRPHERGAWAVVAPDEALAGRVIQQLDSVIVRTL